jgi:PAS domain S-box-containing protein
MKDGAAHPRTGNGTPRVERRESGFVRRAKRVAMEEAMAIALNYLGEGVAVLEMGTHRLLLVNDALCDILGLDADDLLGLPSLSTLVDRAGAVTFTRRLLERQDDTRASAAFEADVRHASGRPVRIEISAKPFDGPAGPRVLVAVIRDVTERSRQEQLLRGSHEELERRVAERTASLARANDEACAAIRARDDLMSMASHELRTPLTPLLLPIQSLARNLRVHPEKTQTDKLLEDLARVERQADRLVQLVDHMLDMSRMAAGRIRLERRRVDLAALTREAVARFLANGDPITLACDGEVWGNWDPMRLDQVVTNLVGNAVKYGEGKPIFVSIAVDGTRATLWVRDSGVGISPEDQQRIFERFERVGEHAKIAGFGLGLWIVREMVQAHGGQIHVVSEPGQGSTFAVELPL